VFHSCHLPLSLYLVQILFFWNLSPDAGDLGNIGGVFFSLHLLDPLRNGYFRYFPPCRNKPDFHIDLGFHPTFWRQSFYTTLGSRPTHLEGFPLGTLQTFLYIYFTFPFFLVDRYPLNFIRTHCLFYRSVDKCSVPMGPPPLPFFFAPFIAPNTFPFCSVSEHRATPSKKACPPTHTLTTINLNFDTKNTDYFAPLRFHSGIGITWAVGRNLLAVCSVSFHSH